MLILNIMLLTAFVILMAIAIAEIRDTHTVASPRRDSSSSGD